MTLTAFTNGAHCTVRSGPDCVCQGLHLTALPTSRCTKGVYILQQHKQVTTIHQRQQSQKHLGSGHVIFHLCKCLHLKVCQLHIILCQDSPLHVMHGRHFGTAKGGTLIRQQAAVSDPFVSTIWAGGENCPSVFFETTNSLRQTKEAANKTSSTRKLTTGIVSGSFELHNDCDGFRNCLITFNYMLAENTR